MIETSIKPILVPGRNCWTADAAVQSCGLLVDGRNYYRAFYRTARQARRYILIAGWKFNSDVRLLRGADAQEAGEEVRFLEFLKRVCDENPELHVHILAWDFSLIYILKWEWFLKRKFRSAHSRIHFLFDSHHSIAGSHHQKCVVVDGHTAFVGGLDINADDWDDRNHFAHNGARQDSGNGEHGPYHDVQACLIGPAAEEIARYFARRWQAAGGGRLELPSAIASATPAGCPGLPIKSRRVALSRTDPLGEGRRRPILEIRRLYADAIAAAEEMIYIENQYFTSRLVGQALARRMRDASRPRLQMAIVLPKRLPSVLESAALEPPRLRLIERLRRLAREHGHQLGLYYTTAKGSNGVEVPALIHSKILIVDDRFLTVGSANTSNRSMGLDTELNVSWEATTPEDEDLKTSIRDIRVNLLAEHCGLREQPELARPLEKAGTLVPNLDRMVESTGRLRHLTREGILKGRRWLSLLERFQFSMDPDRPIEEDL